MSREFKPEVTEGMRDEARFADICDDGEKQFCAMLAHPSFRAQLRAWAAEEMRGVVAGRQAADRSCEDEDRWLINGHNACRAETLANIERWEQQP